ncbi:MAG: hypothetical protein ACI8UO_004058 [Verrucomicrobiales bacterium]|jgi:hypothetical protein
MNLKLSLTCAFGPVLLASCVTNESAPIPDCSPKSSVGRSECIAIAESYRTHNWRPADRNAFHGYDKKGIRVDTPDHRFRPNDGKTRPGWWRAGRANVGVPYQWGGFDTPDSFDAALRSGKYAGDVYTDAKRAALDDAVSEEACGIDCSGFISRCWRLDRSYSTRELPGLCEPLDSFQQLLPGDLVNKHNDHALLFVDWHDSEKKHFMAYETGSPPTWKVLRHPIEVAYVKGLGYKPYRYRNIIKDAE